MYKNLNIFLWRETERIEANNRTEPVFVNLLRIPGIDSQPIFRTIPPVLIFLNNLWGLGTEEE
jgi:hypothetical protein